MRQMGRRGLRSASGRRAAGPQAARTVLKMTGRPTSGERAYIRDRLATTMCGEQNGVKGRHVRDARRRCGRGLGDVNAMNGTQCKGCKHRPYAEEGMSEGVQTGEQHTGGGQRSTADGVRGSAATPMGGAAYGAPRVASRAAGGGQCAGQREERGDAPSAVARVIYER